MLEAPFHIDDSVVEWGDAKDEEGREFVRVKCERFRDHEHLNRFFESICDIYRSLGNATKIRRDDENSIVIFYRECSRRTIISFLKEALVFSHASI